MTASIPNGFSSEELQKLLDNANTEKCTCDEPDTDVAKLVLELAENIENAMDNMSTEQGVPPQLLGKVVMLFTCNRMIDWHSHISKKHAERGELDQAVGWARDAGKFQALANILSTIIVDENDEFTPSLSD